MCDILQQVEGHRFFQVGWNTPPVPQFMITSITSLTSTAVMEVLLSPSDNNDRQGFIEKVLVTSDKTLSFVVLLWNRVHDSKSLFVFPPRESLPAECTSHLWIS